MFLAAAGAAPSPWPTPSRIPQRCRPWSCAAFFLCRRADVDYFFQGNAAEFATDPLAMSAPGAYLDFPTAWRHFVNVIPAEDRGDVVKALAKAFSSPPRTDAERGRLVKGAPACGAV